MDERRQAFRREPIEIDLDETTTISVGPIPWERRTDFGNEVMRQHVEVINETVRLYADPDTGVPQLEAKLGEKFNDPKELLRLGLAEETFQSLPTNLYFNQIVEILKACCEVNGLTQLIPLIDPNSTTPTLLGGIVSDLTSGLGASPKIESGPDSSSPDSIETPSDSSLSPNSTPSSMNSPE